MKEDGLVQGLLFRSPEDGIAEDGGECLVLEEIGMVAHEDIDIARLYVFIRPDDGMIAAHLDVCVRFVGIFIHGG